MTGAISWTERSRRCGKLQCIAMQFKAEHMSAAAYTQQAEAIYSHPWPLLVEAWFAGKSALAPEVAAVRGCFLHIRK